MGQPRRCICRSQLSCVSSEAAKLKKTSRKLEITPAVSALRRGSVTVGGRARRR